MTSEMSETPAHLEISPGEYERIKQSEAVCLVEYERETTGERYASLRGIGELGDMQEMADRPEIVVLPTGMKCIGAFAVPSSALLPPKEETDAE